MKILIEIGCKNASFEDLEEGLRQVLATVPLKVLKQRMRPESLCNAPEAADKLMDVNGNTVGRVWLDKRKNPPGPFEVFVVATRRKDGHLPTAEKVCGHRFFFSADDADDYQDCMRIADGPYGIFRSTLTLEEEVE